MERIVEKISNFTEDELKRVEGFVNRMNSLKEKDVKDSRRYGLFPLRDEAIWEFYCKQEAQIWSAKELDFSNQKAAFDKLSPRIRELFKNLLSFFSPGDGLISENVVRFLQEAEQFEETLFYTIQITNEMTHGESYGLAIVSMIDNEAEQKEVFEMIDNLDCVKQKGNFIKSYIDSEESKGLRYLAAACSEGIFFVSLFAIIFFFRDENILPPFIFLNQQIKRDETLHRDYYSMMTKRTLKPEETERAYQIIDEAVNVEIEHLKYILRTPVLSEEEDSIRGLTIENLSIYVKMLADQICELSGLPAKYNVETELPWMVDLNVSEKPDFYSVKVSNYKRFNLADGLNWKKRAGVEGEKKKKIKF